MHFLQQHNMHRFVHKCERKEFSAYNAFYQVKNIKDFSSMSYLFLLKYLKVSLIITQTSLRFYSLNKILNRKLYKFITFTRKSNY